MTAEMVTAFFPVTFVGILKQHAPGVYDYLLPDWVAKRCPMPFIDVQIPGSDSIPLYWPLTSIVILSGFLSSWLLGTRTLLRVLREGTQARQGLFMWTCALLWYGCMCLGGLFFHCFHIRKIPHMLDVAGTGLSSLFVIAGFAAFNGLLDDRTVKQRLTLLLSSLVFVALAIFSPPWVQEQLYVIPSLAATGTGIRFIRKSSAKRYSEEVSSARKAGHKQAQRWLSMGGLGVFIGLAAVPLDKSLCVYLGAEYTMIFWFFLGCNVAIFSTHQFALVVADKNLHFDTDVKLQ